MIQRGDAGLLWAAGWKLHPGEAAGMSRCEDINFPPWQMAVMGDTVYKQREHAAFHYLWAWEPRWNGSADNSESFYCEWTQRARLQAPQKHDTGTRGKAMTHFCRNCALQGEINHLLTELFRQKPSKWHISCRILSMVIKYPWGNTEDCFFVGIWTQKEKFKVFCRKGVEKDFVLQESLKPQHCKAELACVDKSGTITGWTSVLMLIIVHSAFWISK